MFVAMLLLMIAAGIGFTQAVSSPRQVTLGWLRLGGLIHISLIAVAATVFGMSEFANGMDARYFWLPTTVIATVAVTQLMLTQLGMGQGQRFAAGLLFVVAVAIVWSLVYSHMAWVVWNGPSNHPDVDVMHDADVDARRLVLSLPVSAALLGGYVMTMLLGHAYLTAGGEMTQKPFVRLVRWLAALLAARFVLSAAFGLYPLMTTDDAWQGLGVHEQAILMARYLVGFLALGAFTYMIHDCVKRRANQSATGILYGASLLAMIGEGAALNLLIGSTNDLLH